MNQRDSRFLWQTVSRWLGTIELCDSWNYVRSADNPADSASRGLNTAKEAKIKQWFKGFVFFKLPKDWWNHKQEIGPLEISDPEVKCNVNLVEIKENTLTRFENISNWDKMKRVMALVLKFKMKLKQFEWFRQYGNWTKSGDR